MASAAVPVAARNIIILEYFPGFLKMGRCESTIPTPILKEP
jgi:hypothetical protein